MHWKALKRIEDRIESLPHDHPEQDGLRAARRLVAELIESEIDIMYNDAKERSGAHAEG